MLNSNPSLHVAKVLQKDDRNEPAELQLSTVLELHYRLRRGIDRTQDVNAISVHCIKVIPHCFENLCEKPLLGYRTHGGHRIQNRQQS